MKFKGDVITGSTGSSSGSSDFIMVNDRPGEPEKEQVTPHKARIRRAFDLFRLDKERHLKKDEDEASRCNPFDSDVHAEDFELVRPPKDTDPWKLFRD